MLRFKWLACAIVAVSACSNSAGRYEKEPAPEKVALPKGAQVAGNAGNAVPSAAPTDDTRFHLRPEEGALAVETMAGKAGTPLVANIVVTPASGLHIATDYPIKLSLTAPAGISLSKAELTAGGRDKAAGDATALTEQRLGFAVTATADKPGAYEITGTFKFGICEKDSCHPKRQPIVISVAANPK